MPGLVPGIHEFPSKRRRRGWPPGSGFAGPGAGSDKPGHDRHGR